MKSLPEIYQEFLSQKINEAERKFRFSVGFMSECCETQAELGLLIALLSFYDRKWDGISEFHFCKQKIDFDDFRPESEPSMVFIKAKIGKYFADFAFKITNDEYDKVDWFVVECDEQEFQEKTKQQREYDSDKENYFASKGILVFRVTQNDIFKDPYKCAELIDDFINCRIKHPEMCVIS